MAAPHIYKIEDMLIRLDGRGRGGVMGEGPIFFAHLPSLVISPGSQLAIIGESGSGKSTLLDALALVQIATKAEKFLACFDGRSFDLRPGSSLGESRLSNRLRRDYIGYVPQIGGLVGALTVWQNMTMPMRLRHRRDDAMARQIADRLSIADQLKKYPDNLSVGQRQRVAIARALLGGARLIAADEPTAALDPINAREAIDALVECASMSGAAVLVVTHNVRQLDAKAFQTLESKVSMSASGREVHSTFVLV